ncbi:hypothetical protein M0R45_013019 [Rubus argutus]|uniref:Uncharacterized protein n=1 Tax=Rubus argutus TaxID=59490 RepID=A0AAW1XID4_RUBAR
MSSLKLPLSPASLDPFNCMSPATPLHHLIPSHRRFIPAPLRYRTLEEPNATEAPISFSVVVNPCPPAPISVCFSQSLLSSLTLPTP